MAEQQPSRNRASGDIRIIKQELRRKYRSIRESMDPQEKERLDRMIFERLIDLPAYREAKKLLCFVSTSIEVDTIRILDHALAVGKTVAVPKCLDRQGNMDFFCIRSRTELSPGEFGLLEPDPQHAARLTDFQNSVCILPAFSFDTDGYRLGFGSGYYDRFLRRYDGAGKKLGVCYNSCIASRLPRGRFDQTADYIITPKYVLTAHKEMSYERREKQSE